MMNEPLFSVLMANDNHSEFIAESIQSVELLAAFEEEFDIEMDEEEALAVKTVGDAVDFITKML